MSPVVIDAEFVMCPDIQNNFLVLIELRVFVSNTRLRVCKGTISYLRHCCIRFFNACYSLYSLLLKMINSIRKIGTIFMEDWILCTYL